MQIYVGVLALAANLVVAALVTVIARRMRIPDGTDTTTAPDYHADEGHPQLREVAVH